MGAQVGAVSKGAAAVCALEGLLTRVGADVSLEQPGAGEGLATQLALTGQGVCADVHLQGPQARVRLLTVLAAELLFHLVDAMELSMLGQPTKRGVTFTTCFTLITRYFIVFVLSFLR